MAYPVVVWTVDWQHSTSELDWAAAVTVCVCVCVCCVCVCVCEWKGSNMALSSTCVDITQKPIEVEL